MSEALEPVASAPTARWSPDQLELVRQSIDPECTDDELALFAEVCRHRRLDFFRGEIFAVHRWDNRLRKKRMTIQVSAAGLRTIAERSGRYAGQGEPLWCGPDRQWVDVWLDTTNPPAACKVAVHKHGFVVPTIGIARYASYVQLDKDGQPSGLWKTGPDFMLWKCAEAAAFKRAFPDELAAEGVDVRDLSDAQRVVLEAKRAGLDDDGRHALVAEITDGRTDSTRDLTDEEALAVRQVLAQGADPATGEVNTPAHDIHTAVQVGPGGSAHLIECTCGWGYAARNAEQAALKTRQHTIKSYLNSLPGEARQEMRRWMAERTIFDLDATTQDDLDTIDTEIDRRGW